MGVPEAVQGQLSGKGSCDDADQGILHHSGQRKQEKKTDDGKRRGRPTKKPDIDNVVKVYADALNHLAYHDEFAGSEHYHVRNIIQRNQG